MERAPIPDRDPRVGEFRVLDSEREQRKKKGETDAEIDQEEKDANALFAITKNRDTVRDGLREGGIELLD